MTKPIDLEGPRTFVAPRVCLAAEIKPSTLRTWRKRGFVVVEKEHERGWTLYSAGDLLRICVLARLVRAGVDLGLASRIVIGLSDAGELKRALDGKASFVTVSKIEVNVDDPKKPSGPAFEVQWSATRRFPLEESADSTDSVGLVIDVAKILRRVKRVLAEAD